MNWIRKSFIVLLLAGMPFMAHAQGTLLKPVLEIAEVEINDGDVTLTVFDMPEGDVHQYYLCVGTLGIGDDFVQLQIDPLNQLFLPLGNTLEEAQSKLESFKDVASLPAGKGFETEGVLTVGNPSMGEVEPVSVTSRRFLFQRIIEFSVQRNGYVRATHIGRGDLGSIVSSVKFYRKIHPKEL